MTYDRVYLKDLHQQDEKNLLRVCGWIKDIFANSITIIDSTGEATIKSSLENSFTVGDAVEFTIYKINNTLYLKAVLEHNLNTKKGKENSYQKFRNEKFQEQLRFSNTLEQSIRSYLFSKDFLEINTPLLWNPIKEYGQLELSVKHPEFQQNMYSLLQSPLGPSMLTAIGGLEKTFQFAKCFRWEIETNNPQKTLEFKQLHITMAFTSLLEGRNFVQSLIEHLFRDLQIGKINFNSITYKKSMELYDTDSPNMKNKDILTPKIPMNLESFKGYKAIVLKSLLPDEKISKIKRVLEMRFNDVIMIHSSNSCYENQLKERNRLRKWVEDLTNGEWKHTLLLKIDTEEKELIFNRTIQLISNQLYPSDVEFECVWVEDFPYILNEIELEKESKYRKHLSRGLFSKTFLNNQGELFSHSHDLIINGIEIASGGLKENNAESFIRNLQQSKVYDYTEGFEYNYHIEALKSGAPRIYTLAIGFERLIALLLGVEDIKDIIIFPKDGEGNCQLIKPLSAKMMETMKN